MIYRPLNLQICFYTNYYSQFRKLFIIFHTSSTTSSMKNAILYTYFKLLASQLSYYLTLSYKSGLQFDECYKKKPEFILLGKDTFVRMRLT